MTVQSQKSFITPCCI